MQKIIHLTGLFIVVGFAVGVFYAYSSYDKNRELVSRRVYDLPQIDKKLVLTVMGRGRLDSLFDFDAREIHMGLGDERRLGMRGFSRGWEVDTAPTAHAELEFANKVNRKQSEIEPYYVIRQLFAELKDSGEPRDVDVFATPLIRMVQDLCSGSYPYVMSGESEEYFFLIEEDTAWGDPLPLSERPLAGLLIWGLVMSLLLWVAMVIRPRFSD